VLARWTDLVGELTSRVTRPLRAGSAVVIVTDDRWPVGAETLGLALEAAGVPAGLVSIVHGVDPDTRAALLVAGGSSIGAQVPYTVDLDGGPANRSFVVQKDDDLVRAAHEVVRRAFGRSETLSGQRHGRIGRVLCHNRVFSTFSEEVLLALETTADINDPVPMVDGRALGSLRLLWELGLDEGATMIFGGEPFAGAARVPSGSSAGGASGGGKPGVAGARRSNDRRAWPTIFTNVEPGMSISRLDEPAPVLSLLRTESDAASQNIARTLG
jgi:acyl-CoA reductase-like NAD-dependent aldehyde dehydrogenase